MRSRSHLLATLALLAPLATWAQTESEPNNNPGEADPLTYGVAMSGSIGACSPTDNSADYFAMTLTGQGVLRVQTSISS
ncbi:MAG: hypothetical protein RBT71_13590, partial [Flavobacteriales bacterium]|nr:hypothetical protein [Flavobacteriales bacterium]